MPQVPAGLQLAAEAADENEPPALALDAKVDTFFFTCFPLQEGQVISVEAPDMRTNTSNELPQSLQTNSKSGMLTPLNPENR